MSNFKFKAKNGLTLEGDIQPTFVKGRDYEVTGKVGDVYNIIDEFGKEKSMPPYWLERVFGEDPQPVEDILEITQEEKKEEFEVVARVVADAVKEPEGTTPESIPLEAFVGEKIGEDLVKAITETPAPAKKEKKEKKVKAE